MKRILGIMTLILMLAGSALAGLTYGPSYWHKERQQIGKGLGTGDPGYLALAEIEALLDGLADDIGGLTAPEGPGFPGIQ